jgi:tryptophan-rich sensory protein
MTRMLRAFVVALLVSTAIHYGDNWLRIEHYAPREGLLAGDPWLIPIAWALFAALGVAAYRSYVRSPTARAHLLLAGFSVSGISTLGHLLYEGNDFSAYQWVSVLSDGVIGSAVLAFTLWSAARTRPAAPAPSA